MCEERQGFWLGIDGCDSVREERQGFWLGIDGCDREKDFVGYRWLDSEKDFGWV